jgi:hypothetical protein
MEKGVRKRGSFLLTTQGLEGLLPPVSESDGVSPDVVPVSELEHAIQCDQVIWRIAFCTPLISLTFFRTRRYNDYTTKEFK